MEWNGMVHGMEWIGIVNGMNEWYGIIEWNRMNRMD